MRTLKYFLIGFALLAAFAETGLGATYYVDYSAGDDHSSGLSETTAFKHCPGDVKAGGNAGLLALLPGDMVRFKGGVVYSGEIQVKRGGLAGNPIRYEGGGGWGAGNAVMDLAAKYYHAFNTPASGIHWIEIRGFDIKNCKNSSSIQNATIERHGILTTGVNYQGNGLVPSIGAVRIVGGTNWVLENCKMYEFENWSDLSVQGAETDSDPATIATVPADQAGVALYFGAENIIIRNCEFAAVGKDCIRMHSVAGISVINCDFGATESSPVKGFFSVALRVSGATRNLRVTESQFHEGWQYEGDDLKQRSHAGDWIHIYGNNNGVTDLDPTDIIIEKNIFFNEKTFNYSHGTANIFAEDDSNNIRIRNNLMLNPHKIGIYLDSVKDVLVCNNTVVAANAAIAGGMFPVYIGSGNTECRLLNNILVALSGNSGAMPLTFAAGPGGVESNFNLFWNPLTANRGAIRSASVNHTLPLWQETWGLERNSMHLDPDLPAVTGLTVNAPAGQYAPLETSSVVDAGIATEAGQRDFRNIPRTLGTAIDLGAMEFAKAPNPPERLTIDSE